MPAGGKLISLELDSHHADVARKNIERAGLGDKCEIRVGPGADSLRAMTGEEPFDLVFIDANKDGYPEYLELSLPLTRVGGLILADNTLNDQVLDPHTTHGAALYNKALSAHPGLDSILVPISGKGINGLSIGRKRPV